MTCQPQTSQHHNIILTPLFILCQHFLVGDVVSPGDAHDLVGKSLTKDFPPLCHIYCPLRYLTGIDCHWYHDAHVEMKLYVYVLMVVEVHTLNGHWKTEVAFSIPEQMSNSASPSLVMLLPR